MLDKEDVYNFLFGTSEESQSGEWH